MTVCEAFIAAWPSGVVSCSKMLARSCIRYIAPVPPIVAVVEQLAETMFRTNGDVSGMSDKVIKWSGMEIAFHEFRFAHAASGRMYSLFERGCLL